MSATESRTTRVRLASAAETALTGWSLPVTILDAALARVGEASLGESVDLRPGLYGFLLELPDGTRREQLVRVEGERLEVRFEGLPGDRPEQALFASTEQSPGTEQSAGTERSAGAEQLVGAEPEGKAEEAGPPPAGHADFEEAAAVGVGVGVGVGGGGGGGGGGDGPPEEALGEPGVVSSMPPSAWSRVVMAPVRLLAYWIHRGRHEARSSAEASREDGALEEAAEAATPGTEPAVTAPAVAPGAEEGGDPSFPTGALRLWEGSYFGAGLTPLPPEALSWTVRRHQDPERLELWLPAAEPGQPQRFVQLLQPGRVPVTLALPVSRQAGCRILIRPQRLRYWVDVALTVPEADVLLGFQRSRSPETEMRLAEQLLAEKAVDPMAAGLGAYSLLRFGSLERLRDWPLHLERRFPELPDAAVLAAELLARQGDHEAALRSFLRVPELGLPLASDGLDFLHRRLGHYRRFADTFPEEILEACDRVLERLEGLAPWVAFDQVLTTFEGLDPNRPGGEELPAVEDESPWLPDGSVESLVSLPDLLSGPLDG